MLLLASLNVFEAQKSLSKSSNTARKRLRPASPCWLLKSYIRTSYTKAGAWMKCRGIASSCRDLSCQGNSLKALVHSTRLRRCTFCSGMDLADVALAQRSDLSSSVCTRRLDPLTVACTLKRIPAWRLLRVIDQDVHERNLPDIIAIDEFVCATPRVVRTSTSMSLPRQLLVKGQRQRELCM